MSHYQAVCALCARVQDDLAASSCSSCAGPLSFRYDYGDVGRDDRFSGNMWRYWRLLPLADPEGITTLGEGGTPLLRSRAHAGRPVYLKDETRNPTGSHKDRSLAVAINHGRAIGAGVSVVVSTGSAGISNAALAARAGMRSIVVMTEGTPLPRLYPMYALGAQLVEVRGEIDPVVEQVMSACREQGLYLSTTARRSNPYQSEGNKTIAYEMVEDLGRAPEWVVVPVGGGGTIAGIWRGFCDLKELGEISSVPRMIGVVPHTHNALEVAFERDLRDWEEVLALPFDELPPSILVKLAHAYPPDGMDALEAVRASAGFFVSVTDGEALSAARQAGHCEGVYAEPSAGACLAGLNKLLALEVVDPHAAVVALLSGSGFRETFLAMEHYPLQKKSIDPDELAATLAALARGE